MAGGPVYMGDAHAKIDKQKLTLLNYGVAIFAAIGSFLFGYDSGIIGSVISPSYLEFLKYYGTLDAASGKYVVNANILSAIVSVFAGGAAIGAVIAGNTANRIGRKRTIQLGSLIAIVGCSLQTGAPNLGALIAGRFIAGMSIGVLSMIVPLYQAEISPPHARGLLSGWTQQMIGFGFFIASWVGFGCGKLNNQAQFRIPLAIQIIPAIFLFFGMFFLPYSPRWLASKGRNEEATAALMRLHGGHKANQEAVQAEMAEIIAQLEWERENVSVNLYDLIRTRPNLHRTACACLVQACCQWTGVNVNAYFAPTIYTQLGYTGDKPLMINAIQSAWSLVVTFLFITYVVDRLGRRPPLIWGAIAMAAFLGWQAGVGKQFVDPNYQNSGVGIAGIASIFMYSAAFSMSYGPVSWIYQSEVFPMPLRAMGTSAATATNWINNVIIAQASQPGLDNLRWKFFLIFICTNLTNAVVAYFVFIETKGLTLEEIARVFGDESSMASAVPPTMHQLGHVGMDDSKKMDDFDHKEVHQV